MHGFLGFIVFVLVLWGLLTLMMELGRRYGIRSRARDQHLTDAGLSTIDGAVYGLLALLISFTFAGAANRFDTRRQLVVQEANAIHTAYLRTKLLPAEMQEQVRQDFRDYLDARLTFYRHIAKNFKGDAAADAKAKELQQKIWNESVDGARATGSPAATILVLSSLNEMIDITTTRAVAVEMHPPVAIYIALAVLVLTAALLAGYGTSASTRRSWLHMLLFAGVMGTAIYTILDLEYPRVGLIRVDAIDHVLADLRKTM